MGRVGGWVGGWVGGLTVAADLADVGVAFGEVFHPLDKTHFGVALVLGKEDGGWLERACLFCGWVVGWVGWVGVGWGWG